MGSQRRGWLLLLLLVCLWCSLSWGHQAQDPSGEARTPEEGESSDSSHAVMEDDDEDAKSATKNATKTAPSPTENKVMLAKKATDKATKVVKKAAQKSADNDAHPGRRKGKKLPSRGGAAAPNKNKGSSTSSHQALWSRRAKNATKTPPAVVAPALTKDDMDTSGDLHRLKAAKCIAICKKMHKPFFADFVGGTCGTTRCPSCKCQNPSYDPREPDKPWHHWMIAMPTDKNNTGAYERHRAELNDGRSLEKNCKVACTQTCDWFSNVKPFRVATNRPNLRTKVHKDYKTAKYKPDSTPGRKGLWIATENEQGTGGGYPWRPNLLLPFSLGSVAKVCTTKEKVTVSCRTRTDRRWLKHRALLDKLGVPKKMMYFLIDFQIIKGTECGMSQATVLRRCCKVDPDAKKIPEIVRVAEKWSYYGRKSRANLCMTSVGFRKKLTTGVDTHGKTKGSTGYPFPKNSRDCFDVKQPPLDCSSSKKCLAHRICLVGYVDKLGVAPKDKDKLSTPVVGLHT